MAVDAAKGNAFFLSSSGDLIGVGVGDNGGLSGVDVVADTDVVVAVSGITNPNSTGDYTFDPGDTSLFASSGIRTVIGVSILGTEVDVAPQQAITIGGVSLVNGTCGASNGGLFATAPAANLRATGTASEVVSGETNYTWSCDGSGGGTNASCSGDCVGASCVLNSVSSVLNPQANFALKTYAILPARAQRGQLRFPVPIIR